MPSVVETLLETARADTDLLGKNDELGDVLTVSREVEFLMFAPTEAKAQLVASFINGNRYGDAAAESSDDRHAVRVLIDMPITQNVLCSVSGLMACIGHIFDIDYDGWETELRRRT